MSLLITLLITQGLLLLLFVNFAAYNYFYGLASLFPVRLPRNDTIAGKKTAIVICCFNESRVIADTISHCERLTYPQKTIIVADDSNDGVTQELLLDLCAKKGGVAAPSDDPNVEIMESDELVVFHRRRNVGFKAGNLKDLEPYLVAKGFAYIYVLDADFRPQPDALERCCEVIEADDSIAYVQTKRIAHLEQDWLMRCFGLTENACYLVDLPGRQVAGDMVLFTGCCALFRLDYLAEVGGFRAGSLTEDVELSNRIYLRGFRGVYLGSVVNTGEVAPNYRAYAKQQARWAMGTAEVARLFLWRLIRSKSLSLKVKLSLLRQNTYFATFVYLELFAFTTLLLIALVASGSFHEIDAAHDRVFSRLLQLQLPLTVACFFSHWFQLTISAFRIGRVRDFLFIPIATLISLSLLHTYFLANVRGFFRVRQGWYLTPKTNRQRIKVRVGRNWGMTAANFVSLLLFGGLFWLFSASTGDIDLLVAMWVPAFAFATAYD